MPSYYFRSTGSTAWNLASNWSLTDGGLATGAVPTNADDAFFSNNSGNCTLNAASLVCKTLIFSGVGAGNYSNTFTLANPITVSGNVTLSATMTISGINLLTVNATAILTSNGKTWTGGLTLSGTSTTQTFGDNWQINGSFTGAGGGTQIINGGGSILSVGGNVSFGSGGGIQSGNIIIQMNGTGALAGTNCSITELRFAGTITIGNISFSSTTLLNRISGTVTVTAGTTLSSLAANLTFTGLASTQFATINALAAGTFTIILNGNLLVTTLQMSSSYGITFSGAYNVTAGTMSFTGTGAKNLTLVANQTYTVTSAMTMTGGASAARISVLSSSLGTKAILTLQQGATQNLSFVNFTDIDASLGKTICTFNGTIATSNNVRLLPTDVQTIAY